MEVDHITPRSPPGVGDVGVHATARSGRESGEDRGERAFILPSPATALAEDNPKPIPSAEKGDPLPMPGEARGGRVAALNFIFITVLLDMLALGIIVPVLPRLVVDLLHGNTARAAEVIGLFATVWALMQLLFSPLLGLLSDRFGRRPVILLSNLGLGLDYIVMALAPTVRWLFVGRVLSGITSASITAATAYISDVTPVERRARAFGLIGAAFGVGFVLGPAVGGWLGAKNPRLPFWVAAAFSLLNALYGLVVLPESLSPAKRQPRIRWKDANPLGALKLLRSHPELLGLATVNFLGYVAHEVYATVFVLYCFMRRIAIPGASA
jgi:DHA1 family tetracycline resistance protein-like MFS transporter